MGERTHRFNIGDRVTVDGPDPSTYDVDVDDELFFDADMAAYVGKTLYVAEKVTLPEGFIAYRLAPGKDKNPVSWWWEDKWLSEEHHTNSYGVDFRIGDTVTLLPLPVVLYPMSNAIHKEDGRKIVIEGFYDFGAIKVPDPECSTPWAWSIDYVEKCDMSPAYTPEEVDALFDDAMTERT